MAVLTLPLCVLAAFIVMRYQGVNANIMSLGDIAIAVGAATDAALVLVENVRKHLESYAETNAAGAPDARTRWEIIAQASVEVGPALFFSLLIVTLSFIPVFALEAQEGKPFSPLAYTKTYTLAAAAGLAITLVPVLMGYLIRGRIPKESANPINRLLIKGYRPLLDAGLRHPKTTLGIAMIALLLTAIPISRLGGEFLPPLNEGDLLYMPSALPGLSAAKAS